MSVLIDVVTRFDQRGISAAQKQMTSFAAKAAGDANNAGHAWMTVGQSMTRVGTSMASVGASMTKFVTVPIVAGAALCVRAAMKQQQAFDVLDLQTRSNTKATQAQTKAVDEWLQAQSLVTVNTVSELIPAMGRLEVATKSRTKAEQLLKLAEDLSAGSGKSLSVTAVALSRAYQGTTTSLGRMGIKTFDLVTEHVKATAAMVAASGGTLKLGEATTKTVKVQETWAQLLPKLIKAYGGDAAKAAEGTAGSFKRLENGVHELAVKFGTDLLPMVNKAVSFFTRLLDRFDALSPGTRKLIEQVAGIAVVLGPLLLIGGKTLALFGQMAQGIGILKSAAGALKLGEMFGGLGSVATLGVVAVIAAIVVAIVLLWTKCKWFRDFWKDVWRVVVEDFRAVWPAIKAVGSDIVSGLKWVWDAVSTGVKWFWGWAGPYITEAVTVWWQCIKTEDGLIVDVIKTTWDVVSTGIQWFWGWAGPYITTYVKVWWVAVKDAMKIIVDVIKIAWLGAKTAFEWFWGWAGPYVKDAVRGFITDVHVIKDIVAFISGVLSDVRTKCEPIVKAFAVVIKDVWGGIKTATEDVWGAITGIVRGAWNDIAGFVNKIIGAFNWVISKVPGMSGGGLSLIPLFSTGSGGGSGNSAGAPPKSSGPISTPAVSFGSPHAGASSKSGGIGGALSDIGNVAKSALSLLDPSQLLKLVPFPKAGGGIMAGAEKALLSMAESSIADLIKKFFTGGIRERIVKAAVGEVGVPYLWGGSSPAGFDCSGLMYWAYAQAGKSIPRIPTDGGKQISRSAIQPADIMFYEPGAIQGGVRVPFGHFKMYIGDNKTIEAPHTGANVQINPADWGGAAQIRSYLYDEGGMLPTGKSIAVNNTGRPEPVGGGGRTDIVVNIGTVNATSPAQARSAGTDIANAIIVQLAQTKRSTARGMA